MDLSSLSLMNWTSHDTDIINGTMTASLRHDELAVTSTIGVKTVHGCLVLQPTTNSVQSISDGIVSKQTRFWVSIISSAGFVPLLFVVGVPANILSAAVFYKQGLKDRINFCVFCLAVVDVMVVTVTFFVAAEEAYRSLIGPFNFFLTYSLGVTGFTARISMFLSSVIAAERCFCVVSPLRAQRMLRTRTLAVFIGVISLLLIVGLQVVAGHKRYEICVFDPRTNKTSTALTFTQFYKDNKQVMDFFGQIIFGTTLPAIFFVIVITTTAVTAARLRSASRWRRQTSTAIAARSTGDLEPHVVALTRMLVATSVLFVLCLSPILIVQGVTFLVPGLQAGGRYQNLRVSLWRSINVFRCLNSSLNFFVYYQMGSRFRQTLRELLACKSTNIKSSRSKAVDYGK